MVRQSIKTYMFVPATSRKFIEAVVTTKKWKPDWIIFDFEDAIRDIFDLENEGSLKISARETLASYFPFDVDIGSKYLLRINSVDSLPFEADIEFLKEHTNCPPKAIVLPKVSSPEHISILESKLPDGIEIIPLIETPEGVKNIRSILSSSEKIKSFVFGHIDYYFESNIFPIPLTVLESSEMASIISQFINLSKEMNKTYIDIGFYYDGKWNELKKHCDFLLYHSGAETSLGKLVIHPDHLNYIGFPMEVPGHDPLENINYSAFPTGNMKKYASEVVFAYENRSDKNTGICRLGKTIIPAQVYILAKRYLNK